MAKKEKLKKIFRYIILCGFVILMLYYFISNEFSNKSVDVDEPAVTPTPSVKEDPAKNVTLELSKMSSKKGNRRYWDMEAGSIKVNEETRKGEAVGIKFVFFDEKAKPSITVKANGADIDLTNENLTFKGKVTGNMVTGEYVEIEKLVWNGKKKKAYGYKSVKMTKNNSILKGRELVFDPDKKYVEITGDVYAIWRDDNSKNEK